MCLEVGYYDVLTQIVKGGYWVCCEICGMKKSQKNARCVKNYIIIINTKKKVGPKILPWGIPIGIFNRKISTGFTAHNHSLVR